MHLFFISNTYERLKKSYFLKNTRFGVQFFLKLVQLLAYILCLYSYSIKF